MSKLPLESKTYQITYEELEGAILSYLQLTHQISGDKFVVETDIDVALNDDGLVEFDVTTTESSQLEFSFEG